MLLETRYSTLWEIRPGPRSLHWPLKRSDSPPAEGCKTSPPHGNYRVSLWPYQNPPSPLCPLGLRLGQTKMEWNFLYPTPWKTYRSKDFFCSSGFLSGDWSVCIFFQELSGCCTWRLSLLLHCKLLARFVMEAHFSSQVASGTMRWLSQRSPKDCVPTPVVERLSCVRDSSLLLSSVC